MPLYSVSEQVTANVLPLEPGREICALINDPSVRHMPAREIRMRNVVEIAECIRIMQRAMLPKRFPVITALDAVQMPVRTKVRTVDQFAFLVEIEPPRISPAFAEQLKFMGERMITPNSLLKLDSPNVRRHRAPLAAVKPSIRSPCQ